MSESEQLARCNQAGRQKQIEIDSLEEYLDSVETRFFWWRALTIVIVGSYLMYRIACYIYYL